MTDRAASPRTAYFGLAALLAGQFALNLLLHAVPLLSRYTDIGGLGANYAPERAYVGVLSNGFDNFSYASWAAQAARGAWLFSNLYTAEPHRAALFNPFFLLVGWIARLTGLWPVTIMAIAGLLAGPVLGWFTWRLARALDISRYGALLAVALCLFATGPSLLLGVILQPGIDSFYFDLFPATALISAPYQAVCLALTAFVLFEAIAALKTEHAATPGRLFGAGLLIALLVLVRPYQAGVLGLLFPVCAVIRVPKARSVQAALAAGLPVLPVIAYVAWLSLQPVWNTVASGYLLVEVTRWQIVTGFLLAWTGAGIGALRAVREARSRFLLPVAWFCLSVPACLLLGKAATKFADGAVLDYAVLSAFGLEWILMRGGPRAALVRGGIAVAIGTTATGAAAIIHSTTPEPDRDILAISRILAAQPGPPPLVLTDCATGMILPGFSGARVYAGHWSLTLDYPRKCAALRHAGFGGTEETPRPLPPNWQPDFAVIPAGAEANLPPGSAAVWQGRRWQLYRTPRPPA